MQALRDVSFTAAAGEITCLLGSSGCGKSTLLNLAAGLLEVQQGSIWLGGDVLAERGHAPPPEKRPVGLVFQDGALFPHMSLARNIAFGLSRDRHGSVEDWLDQVGLGGLGERYPHELSGGQQQRAALARAIAPGPLVMLMDEPFASVDIVLRRRLRRDCRVLLRTRGTTGVIVTHDPDEALDIADRIAVMEEGRIIQFGTPEDLRERPVTASVGAIFGGTQVVRAAREGDELVTAFGRWPLSIVTGSMPDDHALDLLVDAERVNCTADPDGVAVGDEHQRGECVRILLRSEAGDELTAIASHAIDPAARYRPIPRDGSVRAFPAR